MPTPEPPTALPRDARPGVSREAFAAQLWNPPPEARAAGQLDTPIEDQAGALKVQLIAIIDEGDGVLRAALYDPEADRLLIVTTGDRIRRHTVTQVAAQAVVLSDGRSATRLALREGRS